MSEKKDREVRKLFNTANSIAMNMLNNEELSDLTPHEIFIGSCKMAVANGEQLPTSYPAAAEVQKENFAFIIGPHDTVMINGDEEFMENLEDADWGNDYET